MRVALRFGKPIFEQSLSGNIQTENRKKPIFRAFFTEKKFFEPFDTNKKMNMVSSDKLIDQFLDQN